VTALRRVVVRAARDDAERVGAVLLELVPSGLEETEHDEVVELAVYVEADAVAGVLAAFPDATVAAVADGWEDAWRDFHRPVMAGGLWLGPPWETPPDPKQATVIDPGRAFGTGAHPTTRLCVDLLASLGDRGSLLDVGCGSGVLAIAGCRLGFAPVLAVDVDPVAVATTHANAMANGVAVETSVLDAQSELMPVTDVAVVNVLLRPVEEILARLDARTAVTSGYLASDAPVAPDWRRLARRTLAGWAADLWERS
jgi:ribosomal protein L11 methyltransferase